MSLKSNDPNPLAIDRIRVDGGTQPRAEMNDEVVTEYVDAAIEGRLPPVTVFYDGSDYWLADGFHRLEAWKRAGFHEVDAQVFQGDRREAVLYSVGANADHGLRRTNEDKRRAVWTLLRDEEWCKLTDSEIAKRCAVSHPFVGKLRQEMKPSCNGFKMEGSESPPSERKATRNGKTYTINTSKIGGSTAKKTNEQTHSVVSGSVALLDDPARDEREQRQVESRPPVVVKQSASAIAIQKAPEPEEEDANDHFTTPEWRETERYIRKRFDSLPDAEQNDFATNLLRLSHRLTAQFRVPIL
ncbi:ParB N-terminal domain-containing protein [Singulisphaera sp. PoT]|uniref:ParB N-terminal domain-containing protein n=1 Tax=Singulisphaera sp. PoT TaxID=3411797 RepID=UPI003BF5F121